MTKSDFFLILANIYLAQNLRDKPVTTAIMSVCYFVMGLITMGTIAVLK
jgi:hypothetical protein